MGMSDEFKQETVDEPGTTEPEYGREAVDEDEVQELTLEEPYELFGGWRENDDRREGELYDRVEGLLTMYDVDAADLDAFLDAYELEGEDGYFLSAVMSEVDADQFVLPDMADVEYLGYRSDDSIVVCGDVGDAAGLEMQWHGSLTVEGEAGDDLGRGMSSAEITVMEGAGDAVGADMNGGMIEVGGDAGDEVGYGMERGEIVIDGAVGDEAGRDMERSDLSIGGDAGDDLGRSMDGGTIEIEGSAGDNLGKGMDEGCIEVRGSVGDHAGRYMGSSSYKDAEIVIRGDAGDGVAEAMQEGYLAVHGDAGDDAAARLQGGTVTVMGDTGDETASGMREGTLNVMGEVGSFASRIQDGEIRLRNDVEIDQLIGDPVIYVKDGPWYVEKELQKEIEESSRSEANMEGSREPVESYEMMEDSFNRAFEPIYGREDAEDATDAADDRSFYTMDEDEFVKRLEDTEDLVIGPVGAGKSRQKGVLERVIESYNDDAICYIEDPGRKVPEDWWEEEAPPSGRSYKTARQFRRHLEEFEGSGTAGDVDELLAGGIFDEEDLLKMRSDFLYEYLEAQEETRKEVDVDDMIMERFGRAAPTDPDTLPAPGKQRRAVQDTDFEELLEKVATDEADVDAILESMEEMNGVDGRAGRSGRYLDDHILHGNHGRGGDDDGDG